MYQRAFCLLVVVVIILSASAAVRAADEQPRWTAVTVDEMCWACARRITRKLESVESVGKIQCDTKTRRVFVLPKESYTLSPLEIWEALEEVGKKPSKLVGPSGTFSSKPKQ